MYNVTSSQFSTNASLTASKIQSLLSPIFRYVQTSVLPPTLFSLALLTIIFNAIVCFIWQRNLSVRAKVNTFLASLASADLIVGLSYAIFPLIVSLSTNPVVCVFRLSLLIIYFLASIGNLLLITIDRYVAISYPMYYHSRGSLPGAKYLIAAIWLYALIAGLILILWHNEPAMGCDFVLIVKPVYLVLFFAGIIYLCAIAMLLIYTRLFAAAEKQERRIMADAVVFKAHGRRMKKDRRYAKTMSVVVGTFFVCWLPLVTLQTFMMFSGNQYTELTTYLRKFFSFLAVANSALNPLVYVWKLSEFRRIIKKLLPCCNRGVYPEQSNVYTTETT